MRAALLLAVAIIPTTAHAATRSDVADTARAIVAQVDACDHPTDAVRLAYLQARKGVSVVQMTTQLGYVPYPTEADLRALVSRVLPLPRTTSGRLLAEGETWLTSAHETLTAAGVCES